LCDEIHANNTHCAAEGRRAKTQESEAGAAAAQGAHLHKRARAANTLRAPQAATLSLYFFL
jgi:hypothetical protein